MIYIVPVKLREEGYNVLLGDRRKVVVELLSKEPNNDILLGVDDFLEQRQTLNYLGLNYKVVIGIPNLTADEQVMYETAANHLIDFSEFNNVVKKETRQEQEVKQFLSNEVSDDESIETIR